MSDDTIVFDGIPIPYGLKGAVQAPVDEDPDVYFDDNTNLTDEFFAGFGEDGELEVEYENEFDSTESDEIDDALDVPSAITVISQTFRTAPDGTQVVDVTIDVSDVEGAVRYEVRVSP